MGQVHSEEYQLNPDESSEDVGDSELNSTGQPATTKPEASEGVTGKKKKSGREFAGRGQEVAGCKSKSINNGAKGEVAAAAAASCQAAGKQEENARRKLSNVSLRNIQLLSMKPQSESDAYADGLKNRRRSSLINLILGAPSRGPRFSDDLCSLSSHQISEYNFGIEFFPDNIYQAPGAPSVASIMALGPGANLEQQLESSPEEGRRQRLSKTPVKATISSPQAIVNSGESVGEEAGRSRRRRSSIGSLALAKFISSHGQAAFEQYTSSQGFDGEFLAREAPSRQATVVSRRPDSKDRKPSLSSMLASIDLTSSFEQHDKSPFGRPKGAAKQTIFESVSQESLADSLKADFKSRMANKGRINQTGRVLRRTGSELSLYSTHSGASASPSTRSAGSRPAASGGGAAAGTHAPGAQQIKETKLIIMLQVCLPFILAGFGNMAAGLVLNRVAHWRAFQSVPIFFVLLPSFVGLKGNIEMTLASRLSTLSNLNLLKTSHDQKRAYLSNLVLIMSQAIGLSVFASAIAILCEVFISGSIHSPTATTTTTSGFKLTNLDELLQVSFLIILPSALTTALILVLVSSLIMSLAIGLANLIQVNPDNLSTLIAALYGDVSCVLVYGLVADWTFSMHLQGTIIWPIIIISSTLLLWPILLYVAYKLKETRGIALSSIPPMLASIIISMGSGAILSIVVGKFSLIALYQPVVNGFGANLIAVQASRVSTWLWCSALRRLSLAGAGQPATSGDKKLTVSLASFMDKPTKVRDSNDNNSNSQPAKFQLAQVAQVATKLLKTILWSFCNSSPNSIAAKLLLIMLVPAHSLYFLVIWLVSDYVTMTLTFYLTYVSLCLLQVFILLTICEPLMTLLMRRHLDPDIFGISILMALADLIGTICLTGAFYLMAALGDVNARLK